MLLGLKHQVNGVQTHRILHAVADLIVIPIQYGLVGNPSVASVWKEGTDASFWTLVAMVIVFGLAAIPAFKKLARAARLK